MVYFHLIDDFIKCYKEKCKEDNEKIELCKIKNCLILLNIIKNNIIIYDIKLSTILKKKYDILIRLSSKTSLTDEEYLNFVVLLNIFDKITSKYIIDKNIKLYELEKEYIKCSKNKCANLYNNVLDDKDIHYKKISLNYIKDDKKRNELIREIFSNKKQVELDKCITNKCNKISLKIIQENMKIFNNKIKLFNIKIPDDIIFDNIKKITINDIPHIIIKFNQIVNYLLYY